MRALYFFAISGLTACGGMTGTGGVGGTGATGGTSGSGGSGGKCDPTCAQAQAQGLPRLCCGEQCVNPMNDPYNCGKCGMRCSSGTFCTDGKCTPTTCDRDPASCSSAGSCCGTECCGAGQLCCDVQGPVERGPVCITPTESGTCPLGCAPLCICASPDTPIATPSGDRAIASLKVGDLVYSVDHGRLVTAPIVKTNRTPVQAHQVVRVTLASGSVLSISGRHPTADGRLFSELRAGDSLDGVKVLYSRIVPYTHDATYDILPASDSGAYFAGGALIGSTLATAPARVTEVTAPMSQGL